MKKQAKACATNGGGDPERGREPGDGGAAGKDAAAFVGAQGARPVEGNEDQGKCYPRQQDKGDGAGGVGPADGDDEAGEEADALPECDSQQERRSRGGGG